MKKLDFKTILSLALVFTILFSLCACADKEDLKDENSSSSVVYRDFAPNFSVTVIDENGNTVEGVVLQLRKDVRVTARTNKNGVAKFPFVATDGYKLYVFKCPDGYEYTGQNFIPIEKDTKEITVEISKK